MAQSNGLREDTRAELRDRRKHLKTPANPQLFVIKPERWDGVSAERRSQFSAPATPTPVTDSEILTVATGDDLANARIGRLLALGRLQNAGFEFSKADNRWEFRRGSGRGPQPVNGMKEYFLARSWIEIYESSADLERLEVLMAAALNGLDPEMVEEEEDPERFLGEHGSEVGIGIQGIVVGEDPIPSHRSERDRNVPLVRRIDTASVAAVQHYFDLS